MGLRPNDPWVSSRGKYNEATNYAYGCLAVLGDPQETQALFLRPSIVMARKKKKDTQWG